jgi:hypothetical protein
VVYHVPTGEHFASYFELPVVAPPQKVKDKDGKVLGMEPGVVTPQIVGSITSYARRYAYLAALGLVAGQEDDDANLGSGLSSPAATAASRTEVSPTRRKEDAYKSLRGFIQQETGYRTTDATLMEWVGDIIGRPMDDLTLDSIQELELVEKYVADATKQGGLPLDQGPVRADKE